MVDALLLLQWEWRWEIISTTVPDLDIIIITFRPRQTSWNQSPFVVSFFLFTIIHFFGITSLLLCFHRPNTISCCCWSDWLTGPSLRSSKTRYLVCFVLHSIGIRRTMAAPSSAAHPFEVFYLGTHYNFCFLCYIFVLLPVEMEGQTQGQQFALYCPFQFIKDWIVVNINCLKASRKPTQSHVRVRTGLSRRSRRNNKIVRADENVQKGNYGQQTY